jgi:BatD DUF11 like domain
VSVLRRILPILIFVITLFPAQGAQVDVKAIADRTAFTTRDVISLTVKVSVEGNAGDVQIIVGQEPGLQVTSLPGGSSSYSWVNGRKTAEQSKRFRISATRPGTYVMKNITAIINGVTYKADFLTLQVTGAVSLPKNLGKDKQNITLPAGKSLEKHSLHVRLESDKAYIDQPIKLTYEIITRDLKKISGLSAGNLNSRMFEGKGFTCYEYNHSKSRRGGYDAYPINIDGERYSRIPLITYYLFPLTAGVHTLPQGVITLSMEDRSRRQRDIFGRYTYATLNATIKSEVLTLEVIGLPKDGKPADFNGSVGRYEITANLDRDHVKVGDMVTLSLTIIGQGRADNISTPKFGELEHFRQFDVTSNKQNPKVGEDGITAAITFNYVLAPKTTDATTIPSLSFTYFDPSTGKYATKKTPEFLLRVEESDEPDIGFLRDGAIPSGRLGFRYEGIDFRHIVDSTGSLGSANALLLQRPGFWLAQLFPPIILTLCWWYWRRRQMERNNPAILRSRRAGKLARRSLKEAREALSGGGDNYYTILSQCLLRFISSHFKLEAGGMTHAQLSGELQERGVAQEIVEGVVRKLSEWDRMRFSGNSSSGAREEELKNAGDIIVELERIKK